jgi:hypothetical protein
MFMERIIIEVKTTWRESYIRDSIRKYGEFCEYLLIATPPTLCIEDAHYAPLTWCDERCDQVGILHIDWQGISLVRNPVRRAPNGKRPALWRAVSSLTEAVIGSPACTAKTP